MAERRNGKVKQGTAFSSAIHLNRQGDTRAGL